MRLTEVESEKRFVGLLKSFLLVDGEKERERRQKREGVDGEEKDGVLIIQFDPVSASLAKMTHAMFLVSHLFKSLENTTGTTTSLSTPKRHIVFLLHVPPGLRDRSRYYALDFQPHWSFYFVDEMKERKEEDIMELLKSPISALVEKNKIPAEVCIKAVMIFVIEFF